MNKQLNDVVLVVDDSPESLGMLNTALSQSGYTVLVALNGEQALGIADKITPDVILLDAVMPELNGFETCEILKQKYPHIPVIFMTGLTDVEDVVRGFEAGGIDYVTKPIAPDEVVARVRTHIQTSKVALNAQEALDHAGKYVFCVSEEGDLMWATPHVYELIESIAGNDESPWETLKIPLRDWLLTNREKALTVDCFSRKIELVFDRQQENRYMLRLSEKKPQKAPQDLKKALSVTNREADVLYWISYGKSNWEIAQILEMSQRTVTKHLEQIYKKLGVDNRTAAAAISIRILDS